MRLGIQHPVIETDQVLLCKQEIEVLQRLSEPEALHGVVELRDGFCHIVDGRVTVLGCRCAVHGFEHAPPGFAPVRVACDAVHVPHRLDCFGAGGVLVLLVRLGMQLAVRDETYRRI